MTAEQQIAVLPGAAESRESAKPPLAAWRRWLLPSFADLAFLFVIFYCYVWHAKWRGLLADGDAGWHIRTGEWILRTHQVPYHDLFSFTRPNDPWFAWEWLSDVIFALLYGWGGLKAITLAAAAMVSAIPALLLRSMVSRGANALVAWGCAVIVVSVAEIHFLARPHLFTLLLLPLALWLLENDRRKETRLVWLLVPMEALWTNLHGGFVILIGLLGLLVAGTAGEVLLCRPERNWAQVKRYGVLLACCCTVTFLNPYGWHLHEHILQFMRSDFIKDSVLEFRSPSFRDESMLVFEGQIFALAAFAGLALSRRKLVEPLWVFALAHLSLESARHVPLCAVALAPYLAEQLTLLWARFSATRSKKEIDRILWDVGADLRPAFARNTLLPVAGLILLAMFVPATDWPQDFPAEKFPVKMIRKHQDLLAKGRVLTSDQWADYLIYVSYPRQKVYIDGRSDFFGESIGKEYLAVMGARYDWAQLMEKRSFDVILCPLEWPLSTVLKQSLNWRVIEDDGNAVLFVPVSDKFFPGKAIAHLERTPGY